MALGDAPQASWGSNSLVLLFLLARLVIVCTAVRKASAARTRLRAVAWSAAGGAALVVMLAGAIPVCINEREPQRCEAWWWGFLATYTALAAAWYGVLAAFLYRSGGRSSDEHADHRVALAGLWLAVPVIATHFALTNGWRGDPGYPACLALVRTTRALFGHGHWFEASFPDARGLGGWITSRSNHGFLIGLQLALAGFLPVAAAVVSLLRVIARRRWVHFVENGRIPGWCLRDATGQWPAGLPVLTGNGRGPVNVLALSRNTADPFRAAEAEPVALVARGRRSRTPRNGSSSRE
jgi:hypothetical protein